MEINKHIIFYPLDFKFIKKSTTSAGIYMIRNILNGKSYIGSSNSIKKRLTTHASHLKCNRHANRHLQSSYNKYGEKSFVFCVLEQCEPILETILMLEQKYLDLKPEYNNVWIAGSNIGHTHSQCTRDKMSKSRIGKPKPLLYKKDYKCPDYSIKKINYRNPRSFKPVIQYDLKGNFIAEYDSIMEAARSICRDRSGIKDVCNGRQVSAYGYLWKFK